ncbi:uncharacterized protein JCM6883_005855 [Sporobolomyces salmoneus]|uniref:uncharacterized protein n=1 Tax=Sporobolomyces salmoneus TaxID=183962 RepID=UPI00316EF6FA
MLVKTAFTLSLAALATAAPLQRERRQIDLTKRGDIVNADVVANLGKHSGAAVQAVVSGAGDVTADVDAKLGHLLSLDTNLSLGLGRLLKGLLGGLLGKRDLENVVAELVKRGDIVNADIGAQVGKNTNADIKAIVSGTGDVVADVDAKIGHLLSLDTNVSLGLGKLLRALLGGLLGKRDLTSEELYKRANDDLVNVDLDSTIGHNSHADVSAVVGGDLDTEVDADVKLGHLLGLDANVSLGLGKLLKALFGPHHKRDLTASVKGNVAGIVTDTEATLSSATGLDLGSYVAAGSNVVGAGLLTGAEGIDAGLVTVLGNLLGVKVDAHTKPILGNLLKGLLH